MDTGEARQAAQAFEVAPVPGWPGFHVRELSALAASRAERARAAAGDDNEIPPLVYSVAAVLCDAQGNLLYDVRKPEDLAQLAEVGVAKLTRALAAVNALNSDEAETPAEGNG
jgi:hypothetical protein